MVSGLDQRFNRGRCFEIRARHLLRLSRRVCAVTIARCLGVAGLGCALTHCSAWSATTALSWPATAGHLALPCGAALPPPAQCPGRPTTQTSRPAAVLCRCHSPCCAVGRQPLLLRCPYRSATMPLLLILRRDVLIPSLHARGLAPSSAARTVALPFMA